MLFPWHPVQKEGLVEIFDGVHQQLNLSHNLEIEKKQKHQTQRHHVGCFSGCNALVTFSVLIYFLDSSVAFYVWQVVSKNQMQCPVLLQLEGLLPPFQF